jgi:hypothetical protein
MNLVSFPVYVNVGHIFLCVTVSQIAVLGVGFFSCGCIFL